MKLNASEEFAEAKATKLKNGKYHLELFLKEDSQLKDFLEDYSKDKDEVSDDMFDKLKEVWSGNIVTFHN